MDPPLPAGWVKRASKTNGGREYYFCEATKESSWEFPAGHGDAASNRKRKPSADDELTTVRVRHLLRKHSGSRRPSSWRQDKITCSQEQALADLIAFRRQIVDKSKTFEELARVHSDCSSAEKGGDLGCFGRGKMQPAFERASFALDVGELSEPVHTDSGVHIILRIE